MIRFVPLAPEHVPQIVLQSGQRGAYGLWTPALTEDYAHALLAGGPAWAGLDDAGRVIGSAGFAEVFPTQASAWGLLGCFAEHALAVTRFVRGQLTNAPWARIEALTRACFPEQARFARACGFAEAAVLRAFGPQCETMILHERVKDAKPF